MTRKEWLAIRAEMRHHVSRLTSDVLATRPASSATTTVAF